MAKVKLSQLAQHGDLLDRYGASIRILGQRALVKPDVLEAIDRAVELTSRNGDAILNVCFPYTSREEITTAVRTTVQEWSRPIPRPLSSERSGFNEERIASNIRAQQKTSSPSYLSPNSRAHSPTASSTANSDSDIYEPPSSVSSSTTLHPDSPPSYNVPGNSDSFPDKPFVIPFTSTSLRPTYPDPENITTQTLTDHMFTAGTPPLDLLVRTSGVERLSDFMLWQCHQNTEIVFLEVLWPEFDLWSFLPVLWEWQWRQKTKRREGRKDNTEKGRGGGAERIGAFKVS